MARFDQRRTERQQVGFDLVVRGETEAVAVETTARLPGCAGEYPDAVGQRFDAAKSKAFVADAFADTLVARADIDDGVEVRASE